MIGVSGPADHAPTFGYVPTRQPVLLVVVCASIFFDALDLSITQIALPSIQHDLGVDAVVLPWVAAAYVVTYGGALLLGGRLTDVLGARPVLLAGLAVFAAASLACGLSPDVAWLITARAVQGVGAALTVPAAVAVLAGAFPDGPARTRAFAAFAVAASSGFSAGLVLGGVLTDGLSWRWIFLAKVPVVAAVLVTAAIVVPRRTSTTRRGLDLMGATAITAASVLVVLGITLAGTPAANLLTVGAPVAVAAVLLAAFLLAERRRHDPLLPPRLLRRRRAMVSDAAALTVLAAPFGVSYLVTVYHQDVLGRSPWTTALVLLPGAVLSAVVGQFLAARLLDRFGLPVVYPGALLVVAAGNALLFAMTPTTATWVTVVATVVSFGLGMGIAYPAATLGGIVEVDEVRPRHGGGSEQHGPAARRRSRARRRRGPRDREPRRGHDRGGGRRRGVGGGAPRRDRGRRAAAGRSRRHRRGAAARRARHGGDGVLMVHRIVVVGAGYAGVSAALRLARRLDHARFPVTVVTEHDRFVERIRLHQHAAGQRLRDRPLGPLFAGTGVRLVVGRAVAVDPAARTVEVEDGLIDYDDLVLAVGSGPDFHGRPGRRGARAAGGRAAGRDRDRRAPGRRHGAARDRRGRRSDRDGDRGGARREPTLARGRARDRRRPGRRPLVPWARAPAPVPAGPRGHGARGPPGARGRRGCGDPRRE